MVRINGGETQTESAERIARSDAEGQWQITRKTWVSHAPSHGFSSYNNASAVWLNVFGEHHSVGSLHVLLQFRVPPGLTGRRSSIPRRAEGSYSVLGRGMAASARSFCLLPRKSEECWGACSVFSRPMAASCNRKSKHWPLPSEHTGWQAARGRSCLFFFFFCSAAGVMRPCFWLGSEHEGKGCLSHVPSCSEIKLAGGARQVTVWWRANCTATSECDRRGPGRSKGLKQRKHGISRRSAREWRIVLLQVDSKRVQENLLFVIQSYSDDFCYICSSSLYPSRFKSVNEACMWGRRRFDRLHCKLAVNTKMTRRFRVGGYQRGHSSLVPDSHVALCDREMEMDMFNILRLLWGLLCYETCPHLASTQRVQALGHVSMLKRDLND